MNKAIGLGLMVAGIVLIIAGISASQSFSSDVSRLFTGAATNKSIWMLAGGAAAAVAGMILLSRGGRSDS